MSVWPFGILVKYSLFNNEYHNFDFETVSYQAQFLFNNTEVSLLWIKGLNNSHHARRSLYCPQRFNAS